MCGLGKTSTGAMISSLKGMEISSITNTGFFTRTGAPGGEPPGGSDTEDPRAAQYVQADGSHDRQRDSAAMRQARGMNLLSKFRLLRQPLAIYHGPERPARLGRPDKNGGRQNGESQPHCPLP